MTSSGRNGGSKGTPASGGSLSFRGITFGYDRHDGEPILKNFTADVAPGEFVCILGPSGCGKSTLLSLAAGLLSPWDGAVYFDDARLEEVNTSAGYMTQNDTLLPWRTTRRNVQLPLEFQRRDKREWAKRVRAETERVGLGSDALDKFPAELSGGMKRRAILARTLIARPRLLLMDEPFAALDAQLRSVIHADFRSAVETSGQTVLFVTHDVEESLLLSDVILVVGHRPLRIVHTWRSTFGRVDRVIGDLRGTPEFAELQRSLWDALGRARVA